MNFLAENIEQLLRQNSCVILSGFGGFIKQPRSAYIVDNKIFPPMVEITFNQMLSHDDGLIAEKIMQKKKVNFSTAKKILLRKIENFKQELNENQSVIFGNIGEFVLKDNLLIFKPFNASFLAENFGLIPLEIKPITKKHKIGKNIEISKNQIIVKLPENTHKFLRYAAIFIVACVLTLFMPDNNVRQQETANVLYFLDTFNWERKDAVQLNQNLPKITTKSIVNKQDTIPISTHEKSEKTQKYHLIVASFETKGDAENFCSTTPNFTNEQLYILKSKTRFRIILQSFDNYDVAISTMETLKKTRPELKRAWVMVSK
jgi:nucleoid DNA-binding protein